jgi:hypothetical protein
VDRYEVVIELSTDGVLNVQETIAVPPDPATSFRRQVAPAYFDRVSLAATTIDRLPEGSGSDLAHMKIEDGRSLDVRWLLFEAARPGVPRVYGLRYRVEGALAVEGAQRRLTWAAIPGGRPYEIAVAAVTLRMPSGIALLAPSGMAEAGWTVTISGGELLATRERLPFSEPGTIMALLSGERLPARVPAWQFNLDRTGELAPAFLAGGAFILIVAVGAVVMLRWQGATGAAVSQQLRTAGLVSIAIGLLTGLIAEVLLSWLGWWPQAVPASLVLGGLLFLVMARRR